MATTDNPFLAAIAAEARRLAPRGYCVSSGHVGDVLGAPVDTPAGEDRLLAFVEANGLEVEHDASDGLIFTSSVVRRPSSVVELPLSVPSPPAPIAPALPPRPDDRVSEQRTTDNGPRTKSQGSP